MHRQPSRRYLAFLQIVYDLIYVLVITACLPFVAFMLLVSRKWRSGLIQRLGFCPHRVGERPAVMIHGVSAGEILAARELVTLIERELPELEVVLSTTTLTGRAAARRAYPGNLVVCFPVDFSFSTRRVITRVRPSLVLLMELELWPNFLLTTWLHKIPVLLANGRMSEKSLRDYKILQKFIPEPMDRVAHYCVQSVEYARRFREAGVPEKRLTLTGSMKFDTVARDLPEKIVSDYRRRLALRPGAFVLVGGSLHPGEEVPVLDAYQEILARDPEARLLLVPRHPSERIRDMEAETVSRGLEVVRLSSIKLEDDPSERVGRSVVLVDTVGELARLYALADLVFVGGSLTRRGGQNMVEPAGLGKAVVVGPNTWNFRDPVELLLTHRGLRQVSDADAVRRELVSLHADPEARTQLGNSARDVCRQSQGATRRIFDILRDYVRQLPPEPATAAGAQPPE